MGAQQNDNFNSTVLSEVEENLRALEAAFESLPPIPKTNEADLASAGFVPATAENLEHVAPGCFVLVEREHSFCWAEVVMIDGDQVGGRLHNELSESICPKQARAGDVTWFARDAIRAMGCERYCWC
jgi:hypothetical protein